MLVLCELVVHKAALLSSVPSKSRWLSETHLVLLNIDEDDEGEKIVISGFVC